jgi:heme/copper-type cytochrome/quinol oxidase subunit 2
MASQHPVRILILRLYPSFKLKVLSRLPDDPEDVTAVVQHWMWNVPP